MEDSTVWQDRIKKCIQGLSDWIWQEKKDSIQRFSHWDGEPGTPVVYTDDKPELGLLVKYGQRSCEGQRKEFILYVHPKSDDPILKQMNSKSPEYEVSRTDYWIDEDETNVQSPKSEGI